MQQPSDAQLLRDYAERGTEAAFAEIVVRHTDLVYSAALRQLYSSDLAGDVTQSVFTDLARKARNLSANLSPEASLVGWLYRGTRFAARDLYRNEVRRTQRERQALAQLHPAPETPPDWEQLRPVLDDAMDELDDSDRDAVLLRYCKNHDLRTVGTTLGISDDAAQKRVSRAVERLREFFAKRGVTVGASGLAVVISANAIQAAPVGLALTIFTAAQMQFRFPYLPREAWSENGTEESLNPILTIFWALKQADETRLEQLVLRFGASQSLDQVTFPKQVWVKFRGSNHKYIRILSRRRSPGKYKGDFRKGTACY